MNKVQQYFKDFPASEKCFETGDGLIFHERGDANMYASGLTDKEVKEHKSVKFATENQPDENAEGGKMVKEKVVKEVKEKTPAAEKAGSKKKTVKEADVKEGAVKETV